MIGLISVKDLRTDRYFTTDPQLIGIWPRIQDLVTDG